MAGSLLYQYPKDLASRAGEYPHRITFSALKKGGGSYGLIALYLPPDALKTAYNQEWGDADMGAIGNAILQSSAETKADLFSATSVADTMKGIGKLDTGGTIKAMLDAAKQGGMQALRKGAGAAAIGGESAVKAMEKVRGEIVNPHKAVMYTGPGGFRTFSYTFTMVAKSQQEADDIASIVKFFKFHMSPGLGLEQEVSTTENQGARSVTTTTGGGQATNIGSSLTLTYPEEWEIQMRVNNISSTFMAKNNILFKIDTCFLTTCSVDYATGGNPAFFKIGAKPQTTTMSLGFKETSIMTKEKINQGF